jgi:hypothetical protein
VFILSTYTIFPIPYYDQYFEHFSNSAFLRLVITFTDKHKLQVTGYVCLGHGLEDLLAKAPGPAVWYTEPPVIWVAGPLSPGV